MKSYWRPWNLERQLQDANDECQITKVTDFVKKWGYGTSHVDIVFQHGDIERHKAVSEVLDIYGD